MSHVPDRKTCTAGESWEDLCSSSGLLATHVAVEANCLTAGSPVTPAVFAAFCTLLCIVERLVVGNWYVVQCLAPVVCLSSIALCQLKLVTTWRGSRQVISRKACEAISSSKGSEFVKLAVCVVPSRLDPKELCCFLVWHGRSCGEAVLAGVPGGLFGVTNGELGRAIFSCKSDNAFCLSSRVYLPLSAWGASCLTSSVIAVFSTTAELSAVSVVSSASLAYAIRQKPRVDLELAAFDESPTASSTAVKCLASLAYAVVLCVPFVKQWDVNLLFSTCVVSLPAFLAAALAKLSKPMHEFESLQAA